MFTLLCYSGNILNLVKFNFVKKFCFHLNLSLFSVIRTSSDKYMGLISLRFCSPFAHKLI